MKIHCAILFICVLFPVFAQSKYQTRSVTEKSAAKDLSFLVTFDKRDLNADFARGGRFASGELSKADLGLRGLIGFDTGNAYKPEPGEKLRFPVAGNADPHKGTLIFWTAGLDYNPEEALTNGKKRGNIALAHLYFRNGARHIEYKLYEYGSNIYFEWWSSEPPHGWGTYTQIGISRKGIKKGQWHQIAATWDDKRLVFYLNGEKISEGALPHKVGKTADLRAQDNRDSFIGVKSPFFEDKHTHAVGIDDFAIYSRALTALEIRNQYLLLLKDRGNKKVEAFSVSLHGVNTSRNDKLDRIEADFDFSALPPELENERKAGRLKLHYEFRTPSGKTQTGEWTFSGNSESRILSGADQPGKYTLRVSGGSVAVESTITRPALEWVHNGLGDEDEVPAIWRDFAVKNRTVVLWNRVYRFGNGPLPESVTAYGKPLLEKAPELLINGERPNWKAEESSRTNRWVVFSGSGTCGDARISYRTRVEFDGLIKFDWTISGSPEIRSMQLVWTLAPENRQFLMTPHVDESGRREISFAYPKTSANPKMLWLVSEKKGGFAFTMENDANWVYEDAQKIFYANKATGECRVDLITRAVRIPENTPYSGLFIATPTRPLPVKNRVIQFGDTRGGHPALVNAGGEGGMTGVFTHRPHEFAFAEKVATRSPMTASIYGAAATLTTHEPEAVYFQKYWEVPGAFSYNMPWYRPLAPGKYVKEYYFSVSACPAGVINDYYLYNENILYHHPCADRVWQVYYDICGDSLCGNTLHGCGFKDRFGRDIKTFMVLNKRDMVRRSVTLAHRYGKTVMLHAQRDFIPMLQGLADYYFPGEQYGALLRRNPYGYTDEISDTIYRSEFNRNVLGVGVIHLPALAQADRANFKPQAYKYTEAMLCMLQSHDIETSQDWAAGKPVQKLWDILAKYNVQSPETVCRLYYEQKEIAVSSPDIRATWYKCPEDRYVIFLANKEIRPRTVSVDLSRLQKGSFPLHEEYIGSDLNAENGKFKIRIPARSFRIVAFPPKSFYPFSDDMSRMWGAWQKKGGDTLFSLDSASGSPQRPCLMMQSQNQGGGCFLKQVPVIPGKRYVLTIEYRQDPGGEGVSLSIQARKGNTFLGMPPIRSRGAFSPAWKTLRLSYTVPAEGKWKECDTLLVTLGGAGKHTKTYFDNFRMEED